MSHLTDTQSVYLGSDPRRVDWLVELPVVSGCHCRLFLRDGAVWIEDLGSTNGTYVHGRRLDPNAPVEVALGELIFLGSRESLRIERQLLRKLDEPASWTAPQRLSTTRVDDPDLALARTLTSSKPASSARSARATQMLHFADATVHLAEALPEPTVAPRVTAAVKAVPTGASGGSFLSGDLLAGRVIRVGRDAENDIVLDAAMVSAFHCTITLVSRDQVTVQDLGSTNGTFLNDRTSRISEAAASPGDVLYLGSYRLPLARVVKLLSGGGRRANELPLPARSPFTIGREATAVDLVLDKPQISRRHLEVRRVGDAFEVTDLGSANGTFLNGTRIVGAVRVTAADRLSVGSLQFRLDPAAGVLRKEYLGDIILQAEGVSVDVPDAKSPGGRKRILDNVSFTVFPTEFVGLMGPSGAGKTTLMMALNGYAVPSEGQSFLNGTDLYENYDAFRGNIGYVPQDDIIFPQLTVYESLYYTARLRLPADTSHEEIDAKIERILAKLEIQQTRDVQIGDAIRKGISGGQRKRVNLAQELITEPALLFLDEPTSGLASEDTINVMRLLRGLANDGKTILLTIHQPSLEAYRLMDSVIYLVQGGMAYYGPTYPDSIAYFHPEVTDPAELEQLLNDPAAALRPLAHEQRDALSAPTAEERQQRVRELIDGRAATYAASTYHQELVVERRVGQRSVELRAGSKQKTNRRGLWRQWRILSERAARIKWKDRTNTAILTMQAPIIAAVLAFVFSRGGTTYFDQLARGPAALFLLVASAVWFGCSNSAREIVGEQAIYRRERMVNLIIPSYVLSKFAVLGAVCALQCAVLLGLTYAPLHLSGSPLVMYGLLLLTSLAGLGMGLTLSALANSSEAAIALVPLLLIPQIILGGVIMPIQDLSPAMRTLASTMAARWGFEAMLHAEYGDDDLSAMQKECGIPDCVWGVNPATSKFIYYPGDPTKREAAASMAGIAAVGEGLIPAVEPTVSSAVCQAFCVAIQNGHDVTPIDRSFGASAADPLRAEANTEIAVVGQALGQYEAPGPSRRTSLATSAGVLLGGNLFLLILVIAILRARDVEVE